MTRQFNASRRDFILGMSAAATVAAARPLVACAAERTAGHKEVYPSLIGEMRSHIAQREDTQLDVARDNNLGFVEIVAANPGVDPWLPGAGERIVLPTAHLLPDGPRQGILLNLVDQRLYFFPPNGGPIQTFPIGTGQAAWQTPVGHTTVVRKAANPSWYVPESIRKDDPDLPAVVRPGPDNPLGRFAMYLGWTGYLIHGTNRPWGVGRRVSHGCIRLYPEGIAKLFPQVPIGLPVTVVSQELKLGWYAGNLYIEVHPNPTQQLELEETGTSTPAPVPDMVYRIVQAAGAARDRVAWDRVHEIAAERAGWPQPILDSVQAKNGD